jgi:hypothetical protein
MRRYCLSYLFKICLLKNRCLWCLFRRSCHCVHVRCFVAVVEYSGNRKGYWNGTYFQLDYSSKKFSGFVSKARSDEICDLSTVSRSSKVL